MIEWKKYVAERKERRPVYSWVGWISGRPIYVIRPHGDDGFALVFVVADPKVEIATASGDGAIEELKVEAQKHRDNLTGGLCP